MCFPGKKKKNEQSRKILSELKVVACLPAVPSSVFVSQRSVYAVPASPSTNYPNTKSPSPTSAPHTETSAVNQQPQKKLTLKVNYLNHHDTER